MGVLGPECSTIGVRSECSSMAVLGTM
jgi:hypothetical protein